MINHDLDKESVNLWYHSFFFDYACFCLFLFSFDTGGRPCSRQVFSVIICIPRAECPPKTTLPEHRRPTSIKFVHR